MGVELPSLVEKMGVELPFSPAPPGSGRASVGLVSGALELAAS